MPEIAKTESYKEKSSGHADIWECSLDEFIKKTLPVLQEHQNKHNLKLKIVHLTAQFLRLKFDAKELKGTIDYEVTQAINEALIYFVNVAHENI